MPHLDLSCIDGSRPVSIIMRHAERFDITTMKNALDALLTEKGKQDALELGKQLSLLEKVDLYHSPVERCRETAEKLQEGLTKEGAISEIRGHLLQLGGPYIVGPWQEVIAGIEQHGHDGFLRKWFSGTLSPELIKSLPDAAYEQAEILSLQLDDSSRSCINVTHDWNIMILREHYFGLDHETVGMPDFMDGMVAWKERDGIVLCYQGQDVLVKH